MDKKKKQLSSCSPPRKFDHLFGPKDSSTGSALFGSIFPPPSTVGGRDFKTQDVGCKHNGRQGKESKGGESIGSIDKNTSGNYQNKTVEPIYYSSSIYYGGQEIYSQGESHHPVKDGDDDDPNGNSPTSASRGNWWQGSLYY